MVKYKWWILAAEAVKCHEQANGGKTFPVSAKTPMSSMEKKLLNDLFHLDIKSEEEFLERLNAKNTDTAKILTNKKAKYFRPMQCNKCAHVYRGEYFEEHVKIHKRDFDQTRSLDHMKNEVPKHPFFGTQVGVESSAFNTTKYKSASALDCTRNYLLRLIVKEKRLVPPQWWLLATQAVFNYELRHNKQIVPGDQPVDDVMMHNLKKFYDDDA